MKRLFILLMVSSCLLCACNDRQSKVRKPVDFYYLNEPFTYNSENGTVSSEIRESAGYEEDLLSLLNVYVTGPLGEGHVSPFPDRLTIEELTVEEQTASVAASDQLCMLTGHDLTLACVCLSRTVMGLTGVTAVNIRVADRMLGGKEMITIHADDLIFLDNATYSPSDSG